MDATGIGQNSLYVRRFKAEYLVSADHPSPERVKARLDEAAAKSLTESLAAMVSRWFSTSDSTICLIRHLEIALDVNASWDREQVARCWAAQLARVLAMTLQGGADGQNVLIFENRAAYIAQFLSDLADGCAWGKWYYESFDGLRMLPVSAAVRTVISEEPAVGLTALLQLPANVLTKVLWVLSSQDTRKILDSLSADAPAGDEILCFQALWRVWEKAELGSLQTRETWQNALRLYLGVCQDHVELSSPTLRAAALALLCLARRLADGSASQVKTLLDALTENDVAALYSAVGANDAEFLTPLFRCPPDWVKEVGQTLLARYSGQRASEPEVTPEVRYTPFGGIFLLLPLLEGLPLERITHGWPNAEDTTAVALVRFLLLAKCCGQARARRVFFDPLVRDLMGIDPVLSPATVARWQAGISRANLETCLQENLNWQNKEGAVGGQTLFLVRVPLPGAPAAVLLDCRRGFWEFAQGYHPNRPDRLIERLRGWLSLAGPETVLLSDNVFVESLRSAFPEIKVEAYYSPAAIRMAEEDQVIAELLARLDKLPDDVSYLSLPRFFQLSRSVDLALSVAAQGVMRAFAWRLPGFASSSLPYLHSNFLDFAGSLEDEPTRRVVRLGRPPLNLILNMTGLARQTYCLNWLDTRPFDLFQEDYVP